MSTLSDAQCHALSENKKRVHSLEEMAMVAKDMNNPTLRAAYPVMHRKLEMLCAMDEHFAENLISLVESLTVTGPHSCMEPGTKHMDEHKMRSVMTTFQRLVGKPHK